MKTTKAEMLIPEDGFNDCPGAEVLRTLLEGIEGLQIVDADRSYWKNERDTLVFQIEGFELYRFGADTVTNAIDAMTKLIHVTHPNEVDTEKRGTRITYRLWWD